MFKLNNLTYVVLSLLYFLIIILSDNLYTYLLVIGLTYLNLILLNRFRLKMFFITLLLIIPTGLSFYLAVNIFSANSASFPLFVLLTTRFAAITISSIMFISAVNFEELILFLMQHLHLPVVAGYPFLSAVNALRNLKNEYIRIKNAYLIRYGVKSYSIRVLYPMLISATRYAYHNGLSMEARGLNKHKTYLHETKKLGYIDLCIVILNVGLLLMMVYGINHPFL